MENIFRGRGSHKSVLPQPYIEDWPVSGPQGERQLWDAVLAALDRAHSLESFAHELDPGRGSAHSFRAGGPGPSSFAVTDVAATQQVKEQVESRPLQPRGAAALWDPRRPGPSRRSTASPQNGIPAVLRRMK